MKKALAVALVYDGHDPLLPKLGQKVGEVVLLMIAYSVCKSQFRLQGIAVPVVRSWSTSPHNCSSIDAHISLPRLNVVELSTYFTRKMIFRSSVDVVEGGDFVRGRWPNHHQLQLSEFSKVVYGLRVFGSV